MSVLADRSFVFIHAIEGQHRFLLPLVFLIELFRNKKSGFDHGAGHPLPLLWNAK